MRAEPPVKRTAELDLAAYIAGLAADLRARSRRGSFDGHDTPAWRRYLALCRVADTETGALLIFTRDVGMHACGWFKNPDFERCEHLSISPLASAGLTDGQGRPLRVPELNKATTARWVRALWGDDARHAWAESPKSRAGIAQGVWHWRVFCDAAWQPLTPRGEVYDTEFTELGWRSASEVIDLTDAGGMTA